MLYLPYDEICAVITEKLVKRGCPEENARRVAEVAAGNSRDGVYSHGINRVRRMLLGIDNGIIDPKARAEKSGGFGGFERWDGRLGIGILNALDCSDRAIELAGEHGIGCVALNNTSHWFRGGTYGWRIAEAGMMGIVFTNSKSNMVYYGTRETLLGTVPLIMALPREKGPVVVDVSMAEYSYGKLELARLAGRTLPTPGGYDVDGNLSSDPWSVMKGNRVLPLGKWKGSAIALALDLAAATLSLGNTSADVRAIPGDEHAISQVFIAINSRAINDGEQEEEILERTLQKILNTEPAPGHTQVRYPGQNVPKYREENMKNGIPVEESIWEGITAL